MPAPAPHLLIPLACLVACGPARSTDDDRPGAGADAGSIAEEVTARRVGTWTGTVASSLGDGPVAFERDVTLVLAAPVDRQLAWEAFAAWVSAWMADGVAYACTGAPTFAWDATSGTYVQREEIRCGAPDSPPSQAYRAGVLRFSGSSALSFTLVNLPMASDGSSAPVAQKLAFTLAR